jgi:hypothetical protein
MGPGPEPRSYLLAPELPRPRTLIMLWNHEVAREAGFTGRRPVHPSDDAIHAWWPGLGVHCLRRLRFHLVVVGEMPHSLLSQHDAKEVLEACRMLEGHGAILVVT